MRLICKAFLVSCLVFAVSQPVLAEEAPVVEVVPEQPALARDVPSDQNVQKSFKAHMRDFKRALFGRKYSDPTRPYLMDSNMPIFEQDIDEDWAPEYWADDKGGVQQVLDDLHAAGILKGQYEEDYVPVLEVGKPFLRLSPPDQRHVIEFVDFAYRITEREPRGIFYIALDGHQDYLGVYTQHGIQFK
jgi:hypothetical protein